MAKQVTRPAQTQGFLGERCCKVTLHRGIEDIAREIIVAIVAIVYHSNGLLLEHNIGSVAA